MRYIIFVAFFLLPSLGIGEAQNREPARLQAEAALLGAHASLAMAQVAADRLRFVEAIVARSQAEMNTAIAQLNRADAAWILARREILLKEHERLIKFEDRMIERIIQLERHQDCIRRLKIGHANRRTLENLTEIQAELPDAEVILKFIEKPVGPFYADNFVSVNEFDGRTSKVLDFQKGNFPELLEFLSENHLSLRPYKPAYMTVRTFVSLIDSAVEEQIKKIEARMLEARAKQLQVIYSR